MSGFPAGPGQFSLAPQGGTNHVILAPGIPRPFTYPCVVAQRLPNATATRVVPAGASFTESNATASLVAEPATLALLGTGLLAVGGVAQRRRRRAAWGRVA